MLRSTLIRRIELTCLFVAFACLIGNVEVGADTSLPVESEYHRNTEDLPNIVVIFTDDQGYRDIGCFGSPNIETPHLDAMASEGVKFTSFYSANSVCSPSRAALLTGCYPPRVSVPGVLFPRHSTGLHPDEITIADLLSAQGYATACIGKWHLGHKTELLPTRQGFERYFGIPYSNDMTLDRQAPFADEVVWREGMTLEKARNDETTKNWVPLMRDEVIVEYPADQTTLTQRYTDEAIQFMEDNKDQPFFLYLPHTMPHIPLFATDDFLGKSEEGLYGDTIEEIDHSTGRILNAIEELELESRTLVIFTSDNGPWNLRNGHGGDSTPLRDYKFSTYEGGMRVPCIMRWPGVIPAGTTCNEIAATIDLFPTFANLVGAELPSDRVIDGLDIAELLANPEEARSPHEAYFYYRGNNLQAMRQGDWKVRRTNEQIELYNLNDDLSEQTNLAERHQERVTRMIEQMQEFDQALKSQQRPAGIADQE